jgi:hypothetical protein
MAITPWLHYADLLLAPTCRSQPGSNMPAGDTLLRREKESVSELLLRLDAALGQALASDTVIDEVLPEIQRRRPR